jgi:hypothetical protein
VCLFAGCTEHQNLPIPLVIDVGYSPLERLAISDAKEEWNEKGGPRFAGGDIIFDLIGVIDDEWTWSDYGDDIHVVYRVDRCSDDERFIQETMKDVRGSDNVTIGYCTAGDCVNFMSGFDIWLAEHRDQLEIRALDRGENPAEALDEDRLETLRYNYVRSLTTHELGHMLGITHFQHRIGVMDLRGLGFESPLDLLTDADLDAFCLNYPCH